MLSSCISASAAAYQSRGDRCASGIPCRVLTVSHCQRLSHSAAATVQQQRSGKVCARGRNFY